MSSKKLRKITEAEELALKPSDDDLKIQANKDAYQERLDRAIRIYKELCLSPALNPDDKIQVLTSFLKTVPDEGREILIRWRDTLPFIAGRELDDMIKLLVLVAMNSNVDSHERSITAVTLYNRAFLNVCFKCFEDIAADKSALVEYRVDACRYLFGSELESSKELSQECLTEIIEDISLPSEYRYKIIAGFISRTGVATYLNKVKIKIPYDEGFVYGLQSVFFYSTENGVRERILSGQHLLQMECVERDEKVTVGDVLLAIAIDKKFDENTKADAADVILRLGQGLQVERAREIITNLGFSAVGTSGKVLGRVKTIYNNSQNAHDEKIGESVAKYIEKMLRDESIRLRPYYEIHQEVATLIRSRENVKKDDKFLAYKALNRISVDTATFTKHSLTLAEIFVRVWLRVQKYREDAYETLVSRTIEELIDMGDTCSSGHTGRFINILSAVDNELRIGFEEQIIANVAGRVSAKVRDLDDADFKASVTMGMSKDADESDLESYRTFIEPAFKELYDELYKEFVEDRYITAKQFEEYFDKAREQWFTFLKPK